MNDRLVQIIKSLEIDEVYLGKLTNTDPARVRRMMVGRTAIDSEFIEQLLEKIPHINESYFLKGSGEMFTESVDDVKALLDNKREFDSEYIKVGVFPDVCKRVRMVREEKGLTQEGFARELHARRHVVSGIENLRQNPSPAFGEALRKKLNVNLNWLYAGVGSMYVTNNTASKEVMEELEELKQTNRALLKLLRQYDKREI